MATLRPDDLRAAAAAAEAAIERRAAVAAALARARRNGRPKLPHPPGAAARDAALRVLLEEAEGADGGRRPA